jgi:hypothetical protein
MIQPSKQLVGFKDDVWSRRGAWSLIMALLTLMWMPLSSEEGRAVGRIIDNAVLVQTCGNCRINAFGYAIQCVVSTPVVAFWMASGVLF